MVHPDRFAGKVVVVTGAAQGLGEAVATRAAREGAAVACIDRSELVHEVAGKLAAEGAQTIALTTDLERYLGASTAMAAARNRFGKIDVLINNVGGTIWAKPYAHYTETEIEAEIRRSLFPTMWCCRGVLPIMLAQGHGVIVNVSSVTSGESGDASIEINIRWYTGCLSGCGYGRDRRFDRGAAQRAVRRRHRQGQQRPNHRQ